jgi:hypothetical protein
VKIGSLPHSFPDGDPVLKQFFVTVVVKDKQGQTLATKQERFGLSYDQILRGPIPDPLIKGGTTKRVPFELKLPSGSSPATMEALLTYALIPEPDPALKERYLKSLPNEQDRTTAANLIQEYAQPRLLTFRTKAL